MLSRFTISSLSQLILNCRSWVIFASCPYASMWASLKCQDPQHFIVLHLHGSSNLRGIWNPRLTSLDFHQLAHLGMQQEYGNVKPQNGGIPKIRGLVLHYSLAQVPFYPLFHCSSVLCYSLNAQICISPPSFLFCNVLEIWHLMLEFGRKLKNIKLQVDGSSKVFYSSIFFLEFFF